MTTFVALGDSITLGMGDPAPEGGWRGWAALLAASLPQPVLRNLATLGALAADVERVQLPAATDLKPDVASVVVGINDTLRGNFDPQRTGAAVARMVAGLRAAGAQVLTMRLPDPGQMLGLARSLARPLARRMRAVNHAVDDVAARYGTVHLDVARDPATYERRYWSVDRLHPNERGHRLIACRFHALLASAGYPVGPGPDPEPSAPPPSGWRRSGRWPPRARRGWRGGPGIWSRRCWPWPSAKGWPPTMTRPDADANWSRRALVRTGERARATAVVQGASPVASTGPVRAAGVRSCGDSANFSNRQRTPQPERVQATFRKLAAMRPPALGWPQGTRPKIEV